MLSDPKNPITFFGREIRANFINGKPRPRIRSGSNTAGGYHAALLKGIKAANNWPTEQTQDQSLGWAARDKQTGDRTGSSPVSDIKESH
jgi:hypothetical protein